MRKIIGMLSALIFTSTSLIASENERWNLVNACQSDDWPSPINIEIGAGFRREKLEWSISGPDNTPNVLSELEWRDLRSAQIEGRASYVSCRNYAVEIAADYGHIYHGDNIDSDYLFDDEEGLFSLSKNKAGKGHVYDLSGGVGYRVTSTCARFIATPLIGYSNHAQYLHIYDGHQKFNLFSDEIGSFPGLKSTYHAHWYGPWLGLNFSARVESCAYVFGSFDWHWLSYHATGDWNLRDDIGRFHHQASGHGYGATLGGNWEIWDNWSIGIVATYRHYKTHHGREKLKVFDTIEGPIFVRTRFNTAKWVMGSISGVLMWRF